MRLEQSRLQNVKIGLHTGQALCLFIAMCLMFALFAQADGKNGGSDGRNKFYIALVRIAFHVEIGPSHADSSGLYHGSCSDISGWSANVVSNPAVCQCICILFR